MGELSASSNDDEVFLIQINKSILKNDSTCLTLLLEGPKFNVNYLRRRDSPIYVACESNNVDSLRLLLKYCDDTCKIVLEMSLLLTSSEGFVDCVETLLKSGVDVNARNLENGNTALIVSSKCGHAQCVAVLLSHMPDLDLTDSDGFSAVHQACACGFSNCLELLLRAGAKMNTQLEDGTTPLISACLRGSDQCVRLLLSFGADFNMVDNFRHSAVFHCIYYHKTSCLIALLEANAIPSERSDHNREFSYLMMAAFYNYADCVQALLDHGFNVDEQDPTNGMTALMYACQQEFEGCIQVLLDHGCDANLRNSEGMMAIEHCNYTCRSRQMLHKYMFEQMPYVLK